MSDSGNISYQPTDGLSYDPSQQKYWDAASLDSEIRRVFEICHGCRLCFKFCDTFPDLFSFIDNRHDGDVRKVTAGEIDKVFGECFQCKLCEVNCPYTPRDGHAYQLDFPKLVHRHRAVKARASGIPIRDRVLANPDATARMARASLGLANVANRVPLNRWFIEKTIGVHRHKLLPDFAAQTFDKWAQQSGRVARAPGCEAVLFQTCFVQHNEPGIGRDAITVLEKNRVDVKCVEGFVCCGMPAWEKGDLKSLQSQARHNLELLRPFVEKGAKVLVINPTCSMMFRREYAELLPAADRELATKVATATMDPCEYLWSIREESRFNTDFKSAPEGPVAYHTPCHLRAQAVGFRARDLLRKIPGVKPVLVQECCGHNGTYAMTVEGFGPSQRIGKRAFEGMKDAKASLWSTDCPLAALQFQQHAGIKPMHPLSILARAYREDGFGRKLATADQEKRAAGGEPSKS